MAKKRKSKSTHYSPTKRSAPPPPRGESDASSVLSASSASSEPGTQRVPGAPSIILEKHVLDASSTVIETHHPTTNIRYGTEHPPEEPAWLQLADHGMHMLAVAKHMLEEGDGVAGKPPAPEAPGLMEAWAAKVLAILGV